MPAWAVIPPLPAPQEAPFNAAGIRVVSVTGGDSGSTRSRCRSAGGTATATTSSRSSTGSTSCRGCPTPADSPARRKPPGRLRSGRGDPGHDGRAVGPRRPEVIEVVRRSVRARRRSTLKTLNAGVVAVTSRLNTSPGGISTVAMTPSSGSSRTMSNQRTRVGDGVGEIVEYRSRVVANSAGADVGHVGRSLTRGAGSSKGAVPPRVRSRAVVARAMRRRRRASRSGARPHAVPPGVRRPMRRACRRGPPGRRH